VSVTQRRAEKAKLVREMARQSVMVPLSTLRKKDGHPFVSTLAMATDSAGTPILMGSELSKHTHNFKKDPRVSLLVQHNTPLSSNQDFPRASIVGDIKALEDKEAQERYLRRYPQTRQYLDFGDFGFYYVDIKNINFVGGFASVGHVRPEEYLCESLAPEQELGAIQHMNEDHRSALTRYGKTYLDITSQDWNIVGIDVEGFDMALGDEIHRLNFPETVTNNAQLRKNFTDM